MSAKFGVAKKLGPPKRRLLPWPLKRRHDFRPSVPGTSDVLRSNARRALFTFAGISAREAAETMVSFGPTIFIASIKSADVAEAIDLRSVLKAFLPIAVRVPFKSFIRRTTSPSTAMISGELKRLWPEAL